jgi:hypothetical protein
MLFDDIQRRERSERRENASEDRRHRPFDERAFERLPKPTKQDPPYRDWWVVEPRGE